MNAIMGPNGAGKSNLFAAITGAITNKWVNHGNKLDNVNWFAGDKDLSAVRLVIEKNGQTADIGRVVSPSNVKSTVTFGDGETVRGDNPVTNKMLEFLGINEKMLMEYLVVRQKTLSNVLTSSSSDRAKAFSRLFGTEECERIYDMLGKKLNAIHIEPLTLLDPVKQSIKETKSRLSQIEERLKNTPAVKRKQELDREDSRIVHDFEELQKNARLLAEEKLALGNMITQENAVSATLAELQSDLDTLKSEIDSGASDVEASKAAITTWKSRSAAITQRDKLSKELDALGKEHKEKKMMQKPTDYLDPNEWTEAGEALAVMAKDIELQKSFIEEFNVDTGVGECPTCGTESHNLLPKLEQYEKCLPGLENSHGELTARLDASQVYAQAVRDYNTWKEGWQKRQDQTKAQLESIHVADAPEGSVEDLEHVIAGHKELQEAYDTVLEAVRTDGTKQGNLRGQIEVKKAQVRELEHDVTSIEITAEGVEAAKRRITEREDAHERRAVALAEKKILEDNLATSSATLAAVEKSKADNKKKRAHLEVMTNVRDAFHRDNMPRDVAAAYLHMLTQPSQDSRMLSVNDLLETFEADFRVQVLNDLSFKAVFHDGREQPAGRLSGGQQVVLALSFRIAVNSLFAGAMGLLCLDEPTEYLDEHNMGCLAQAFERLRSLAGQRGLQVIVITHAPEFAHLFDKVIRL
jgi:DNA repair exonuclease SbcCD ATPase subunit